MRLWRRWALALMALCGTTPVSAESILFVGNSFTFGAHSPVMRYRPDVVRDLNKEGIGGVPALFKTFAEQAGLDWTVSLETSPGKDLAFHYEQKRREIDRRWDVVILQDYSTLDAQKPGDPVRHVEAVGLIADLLRRANPRVRIELVSTRSRADLTYRTPSPAWQADHRDGGRSGGGECLYAATPARSGRGDPGGAGVEPGMARTGGRSQPL